MPTQIIDGFKVNAMTPIDSRMVTSGTVSRDNLAYKYNGLRVFDTVQKIPFVYIDGQWKQELEQTQAAGGGGAISASGKKNYLSKFDTNGLTNSVIREASGGANTFVGINIPINSPIQNQLHVGGVVQASSFCGNILGTFVNVGTLPLNRLSAPVVAGNYVLKYQNGAAVWGTFESTSTNTSVENDTQSSTAYLNFTTGTTGAQTIKVSCLNSNLGMTADLNKSQLLMANTNGATTPSYSFIGANSTGFYGNETEVGISLTGNKRISAVSNKLEISTGGSVNIDAGINYVQVCKDATFTKKVDISGVTTVTNTLIATNFQMPTTNGAGKLLTSDATGNATWQTGVSLGVPVGTIIIFLLNGEWTNIPAGWKPCTYFSSTAGVGPSAGNQGIIYGGRLFMNGSYKKVPDMRDQVIMGSTDMKTDSQVGNQSPSIQANVTLGWHNLPSHKHNISTSTYGGVPAVGSGGITYPFDQYGGNAYMVATSTFKGEALGDHSHTVLGSDTSEDGGNDGRVIKKGTNYDQTNDKTTDSVSAGTPKGSVTTTLSGWTDDGGLWIGGCSYMNKPFAIPHEKKQRVMFIIKIDPNATANTSGHFKIMNILEGDIVTAYD